MLWTECIGSYTDIVECVPCTAFFPTNALFTLKRLSCALARLFPTNVAWTPSSMSVWCVHALCVQPVCVCVCVCACVCVCVWMCLCVWICVAIRTAVLNRPDTKMCNLLQGGCKYSDIFISSLSSYNMLRMNTLPKDNKLLDYYLLWQWQKQVTHQQTMKTGNASTDNETLCNYKNEDSKSCCIN